MKNKTPDIIRWVALLPAVVGVWYVVTMILFTLIAVLDMRFGISAGLSILTVGVLISLPVLIGEFFVSRLIAPNYKNTVAIIVVVLLAVWQAFFFEGLAHMAY